MFNSYSLSCWNGYATVIFDDIYLVPVLYYIASLVDYFIAISETFVMLRGLTRNHADLVLVGYHLASVIDTSLGDHRVSDYLVIYGKNLALRATPLKLSIIVPYLCQKSLTYCRQNSMSTLR